MKRACLWFIVSATLVMAGFAGAGGSAVQAANEEGYSTTKGFGDTNLIKWNQPPVSAVPTNVFYGWNQQSMYSQPAIAADDWLCTTTNPVTKVRWWGSFMNWQGTVPPQLPPWFLIRFWTDAPAGQYLPWSHPAFQAGPAIHATSYQWKFVGWDYDPRSGRYESCFLFEQTLARAEWFHQYPDYKGTNVFWISIEAFLQYPTNVWGWKTRPRDAASPSPDAAVTFDPYTMGIPYNATPITFPTSTNKWDLAFELVTASGGGESKWEQVPDLSYFGMDVRATTNKGSTLPGHLLADDFLCTSSAFITNITIWGSLSNDFTPQVLTNISFTLSIHDDIPVGGMPYQMPYSMPGAVKWLRTFTNGQYTCSMLASNLEEGWLTPPAMYKPAGDTICYQYDFQIPLNQAFFQAGSLSQPKVYWLDLQAVVPGPVPQFGWKTSTNHWNDDAVWALGGEPYDVWAGMPPWNDLRYPPGHQQFPSSMDLAFRINGLDETSEDIKWSQPPVLYAPTNGYNGWNEKSVYESDYIVADDWVCTNATPVTDLHWWGSFIGWPEPVPPQMPGAFVISFWTDVPQGPNNTFSHPGVCITNFTCTSFSWSFDGWDFDPRDPGAPPEACFRFDQQLLPAEYFVQPPGTNTYWISIAAQYPAGQLVQYPWGWKTRPRDTNSLAPDDAVRIFSPTYVFPGVPYQSGASIWWPTTSNSWDMAFVLTTEKTVVPTEDFGDAPDLPFPTLLASDGARHTVVPGVMMGKLIDAELNGQPNATATGDDSNGLADEDGVVLSGSFMVPGDWATVYVAASTNGFLSAWVDFRADGSWTTPGDQIFTNLSLPKGTNTLYFYVPANAAQGNNVFARFRFSTSQITNFTGLARDGEVEDYAWYVAEMDYGDAPDPSFATLFASNGARHWRFQGLQLGALWDRESNGQPNAWATGDDLSNLRDEDGVQLLTPMLPGSPAWIRVFPSLPNTFLSAWIDFGADGSWSQPTDQIFAGFLLTAAGWTNLSFVVPPTAAAGSNVFVRFRYSTAPVLTYTNLVGPPCMTPNGEVEDYLWRVSQLDFGDAPDPTYPTWLTNKGANHLIVPGFCLGTNISGEWDGQPNATATGDSGDDGVFFITPLTLSSQACVNVFLTAGTNGGKLDAWIDFNRNGAWDAGEQVFASQALVPGLNTNLCFNVPAGAALGQTFARFRLSSAGGLPTTGYASDGEVEDYRVRITQRPLTANCVITNIFLQNMYYGWNEPSIYASTNIAADDWVCTTTNPVTAIRWWGSFLDWRSNAPPALPPAFHIAIWDDVPAQPPGGFSHPGRVLWVIECTNYTCEFAGWDIDPRARTNETCYLFEQQLAPSEWFYQTNRPSGSNIYWISIAAIWPQGTEPSHVYGWKTRPRDAKSPAPDDAVRVFNPTSPYLGATYQNGEPIYWPNKTNSWDLAFELVSHYEHTTIKWEQPPDLTASGIDVNATSYPGVTNPPPYLLADDFQCHSTGPLTDITIWGSWTNDYETPQNLWFTLSIHSDVPAQGTNHSRPGPILWQQTFMPGQYLYQLVQLPYQLFEGWLTPPANYFFPADHACFQVDFALQANAFIQTNGTIYWLDVQAHLPPAPGQQWPAFGWKTSTLHWNDDAVWVNATEPYNGNAWKDLRYPPGHQYYPLSIDLAFRLASLESVYQLKWSQPPIPSVSNRFVTIEWNAESGIQYQLLAAPGLGTNNGTDIVWSAVGPVVIGPAHSMSDANATAAQRFYRVLVP